MCIPLSWTLYALQYAMCVLSIPNIVDAPVYYVYSSIQNFVCAAVYYVYYSLS